MVSLNNNELKIAADSSSLYKAIADDFMQRANDVIHKKGLFTVVLSGGNTPKKLFSLLSTEPYKSGVPWDKIYRSQTVLQEIFQLPKPNRFLCRYSRTYI